MKPVTRLFDTRAQAQTAIAQLEAAGIDHARLSLIARKDGSDDLHHSHAGEGAATGATTGGLIGGGAGLLAGLGMLAIPGVGPVVAAGWLAATLTGAVAGA
ncbi:MAG: hypothetical protein JWM33_985, partial [Caulobacteraceae bacterium]|nr:hypothetical protein [Caulobacteraceae bacterium]